MSNSALSQKVTVGFTPANQAVTRDPRDAPFQREMTVEELLHHVIGYTHHDEERYRLYHDQTELTYLGKEFYYELFEHWDEDYHRGSAHHTPIIGVTGSQRWDAFRLQSYHSENDWSWVFAEISWGSCGLHARMTTAPDNILVDYEGNLRGKDPGQGVYYPAFQKPWPRPIWNPNAYVSLGKLNYLLNPSDDNELTMLIRSPQPYQGMGRRLAAQLTYIRNEMLKQTKA